MNKHYMKVNDVVQLTGVTARALHYYDKIGLLRPTYVAETGYRYYTEENLEQLQQILFYRELEFSLKEIKEIFSRPGYDEKQALRQQKELLRLKKERLEKLMSLIDKKLNGGNKMSFKEFDMKKIEETRKKYTAEAIERWGDSDAYRESQQKTDRYTKKDWALITQEANQIFAEFWAIRGEKPDSDQAFALVQKWQKHITKNFYNCTDEILAGLGLMYQHDERFAENIDQAGSGTAAFMSEAIAAYCAR